MSIVFRKQAVCNYKFDDYLDPKNEYCILFGWYHTLDKSYEDDNTWSESYWDGDGYSSSYHGSITKFHPVLNYTFTEIRGYEKIAETHRKLQKLAEWRPHSTPWEPSNDRKKLAKAKGTYKELMANYKERCLEVAKTNQALLDSTTAQYNTLFRKIVSTVYPTLTPLPDCPMKKEHNPKQYKEYMRAVKKQLGEIEKINGARLVKAIDKCSSTEFGRLPKKLQKDLLARYKHCKKITVDDSAWIG